MKKCHNRDERKKIRFTSQQIEGRRVPAKGALINAPAGHGAAGSRNTPFFRASRNADTETRKSLSLPPFVLGFEVAEVLQIVALLS
jgi:hypothetical protein